ncbi:SPOR domain-containing protein [Xanthomonas maliensis]|uniref:SPOR domain-containing protein n=1 Tax=Xanthomonas maliensis TaxID=1321368 RepID=UPI0004CF2AF3|nr:SPOR domain-containing protein [Xanthomonas maliensis]KAB7766310.1 SPOR domain-containing protein [Xanthomonas maliensis]
MDTTLKQRLIGAIVLVALAVIFLPMLVKGPAPSSGVSDVPLDAPAAPGNSAFETRELPLVTPGNAPAGGALGMPGAATAPAPVQDNPDAADLANPAASGPEVAAGNYAVNFGAYATSADADAVIARLKQAQLPAFSEQTQISGRPAWRVRVGPYADQAQAESARLQAVKVRSDVNAQVVTLDANAAAPAAVATPTPAASSPAPAAAAATSPAKTEALPATPAKPVVAEAAPSKPAAPKPEPAKPEAAKPEATKPEATKPAVSKPEPAKPVAAAATVATPSAPAAPAASGVGFAVQLGAFARAEDANALRDKVRAAGFSAFVEQVRTDKGALSRVRVGPVANRSEAEQLRAQVAAKVGISGMVRPHP